MEKCEEARKTETAIANACHMVLEEHISNPWRWPRESDVVGSLVNKIHDSLKEKYATPCLRGKGIAIEGIAIGNAMIPRVRTEARILGAAWKIDVCLQTKGVNDIFFGRGGHRDALLTVSPNQLEEILEVKLDPGRLYTSWIDDLVKLHMIRELVRGQEECRLKSLHSLFIDTSLLLSSLGCASEGSNENLSKAKRVPVWPFEVGRSTCFEYQKSDLNWRVKLECVENRSESDLGPHIYFWAIGFKLDDTSGEKIPVPACWKVGIEKDDV